MTNNNIIVKEYLESLKEDKELDYLFPILLNLMGFRIVQTAKEAKGQSQYGKDIIAIGNDTDGMLHRWYFELKGFADKDITDANYSKTDGIRESIIEAKDTPSSDSSIPKYNILPIKIVVVHNGILKTNIKPTFDGFITKEFPNGGFERWDIYHLTDLFGQYFFSENLLVDAESSQFFKRTLVFLDASDYDFNDFKTLIEIQIDKLTGTNQQRNLKKFFATLNLLGTIVFHYSQENNNLRPAKTALNILILRIWAWILEHKLENKKAITNQFNKLLDIQRNVLDAYFEKTLSIAKMENGLFAENGGFFEQIGYPLRCFEYVGDLVYYYQLKLYKIPTADKTEYYNNAKEELQTIIVNNPACLTPLLDNHSIPMMEVVLFLNNKNYQRPDDCNFIKFYICSILDRTATQKQQKGVYPELHNNIDLVAELFYSQKKPKDYQDSSSILVAVIFELLSLLDISDYYNEYTPYFKGLSLQVPFPLTEEFDIELLLFKKNLYEEYAVENDIEELANDITIHKTNIQNKNSLPFNFRTYKAGFAFLRTLAHLYFKNERFPYEWRTL